MPHPHRRDASPVVALWRDRSGGVREIPLETGAQAVLLTVCIDRATRRSADGRWPVDNGSACFDVAFTRSTPDGELALVAPARANGHSARARVGRSHRSHRGWAEAGRGGAGLLSRSHGGRVVQCAPGRSLAACDAAGAADRPARRRDRLAAPIRCRECDLERILHIRFGTRRRPSGSTGREAARQDGPPRIALDARGTTDSTDGTPRAVITRQRYL
jgi:hypothetical protein